MSYAITRSAIEFLDRLLFSSEILDGVGPRCVGCRHVDYCFDTCFQWCMLRDTDQPLEESGQPR